MTEYVIWKTAAILSPPQCVNRIQPLDILQNERRYSWTLINKAVWRIKKLMWNNRNGFRIFPTPLKHRGIFVTILFWFSNELKFPKLHTLPLCKWKCSFWNCTEFSQSPDGWCTGWRNDLGAVGRCDRRTLYWHAWSGCGSIRTIRLGKHNWIHCGSTQQDFQRGYGWQPVSGRGDMERVPLYRPRQTSTGSETHHNGW